MSLAQAATQPQSALARAYTLPEVAAQLRLSPQWRAEAFTVMRETPNLVWLLLTKRPQNIARMAEAATCQEVERLGFMTHDAKSMSRNASTLRDFSELALESAAKLEAMAERVS